MFQGVGILKWLNLEFGVFFFHSFFWVSMSTNRDSKWKICSTYIYTFCRTNQKDSAATNSRRWFQIFLIFTPKIVEDEPILTHIFQMCWLSSTTNQNLQQNFQACFFKGHAWRIIPVSK